MVVNLKNCILFLSDRSDRIAHRENPDCDN